MESYIGVDLWLKQCFSDVFPFLGLFEELQAL